MALKIVSYPKLRKTSVLAGFLGLEEMKNFKALLDRSGLSRNTNDAFLVHDDKSFVLSIISRMPHNSSQVTIETYIPADFILSARNGGLYQDDSTSISLWEKTVSFLTYELFFIQKLKKIVFYIASNRNRLQDVLSQYRFCIDGRMREHLLWNNKYYDADICSLTDEEFDRYSTGVMPILDEYLVVRSTNSAVFAIDVIKRGMPLPAFVRKQTEKDDTNTEMNTVIDKNGEQHGENAYPYVIRAMEELSEYFKGLRKEFDLDVEIFESSDFQKNVWAMTVKVPYGQTFSYEDISRRISGAKHKDNPNILSRAVGTALSRNPVMIVIPCHRIIGKDGKLRGFAGGLDIKDYLLTHELTHY
ncbi:MAG: methylated-DNA--[protein]-cysteine S-methyltransferase [Saccharofermentanales bacterium]